MIPIMGAYIASSIADKPAFAPAFLVCYLANDKALLGTQSGAGFLGAVVLGLAIGDLVLLVPQSAPWQSITTAARFNAASLLLLCWFSACSLTTLSAGDVRPHGRGCSTS